ncbi:MAG: hypothetical protein H7Y38_12185 [Armatimonadetes bacterium]|nr:hypothetical protein [Armatimonadota bacterium]
MAKKKPNWDKTKLDTWLDGNENLLLPNGEEVAIRMYGQGLGDCFLLAFPHPASAKGVYHVVIDCGVVQGTPDPAERMRKVVTGLHTATGGAIDLLVVTHQHWDHVNGFLLAEDLWANFAVETVWLAWTEGGRPELEAARRLLDASRKQQEQAVRLAAQRAVRHGLHDDMGGVLGMAAFLGAAESSDGEESKTDKAMEIVKQFKKQDANPSAIEFCEPGEVRPLPGLSVDVYVLGPPTDYADLKKTAPGNADGYHWQTGRDPNGSPIPHSARKTESPAKERAFDGQLALRRETQSLTQFNAFASGIGSSLSFAASRDAADLRDRSYPFDRTRRVAWNTAETEAVTEAKPAQQARHPALNSYFDPVNKWRRIDFDWLGVAENFAIKADSLTNNTSLVLAFELPKKSDAEAESLRRVLLFVGDAQAGNWLSWDKITAWNKHDSANPSQAKPDMDDLLGRVIFYKVGHHGSHNATLQAQGIDRMATKSGELTAFLPVSYPIAHLVWRWCEMPFEPICDALMERPKGRVFTPLGLLSKTPGSVVQNDHLLSALKLPAKVRASDKTVLEGETPLWVQVSLPY